VGRVIRPTNGVLYQLSYIGLFSMHSKQTHSSVRIDYSTDIFNHRTDSPFEFDIIEVDDDDSIFRLIFICALAPDLRDDDFIEL